MNEEQSSSIVVDLSMALEKAAVASDLDVLRLDSRSVACYIPVPLIFLGVAGPSVSHISHRMCQSTKYLERVFRHRGVPFSDAEADADETLRVMVIGDSFVVDESIDEGSAAAARNIAKAAITSLPGAAYGCVSMAMEEQLAVTSVDLTLEEWAGSASKTDIDQVAKAILDLELSASQVS